MHPTKRQIASVIRKAARSVATTPRMTEALFTVCQSHGKRASLYYDRAIQTIKAYSQTSFTTFTRLPKPILQREMRRAARALEHGLEIRG